MNVEDFWSPWERTISTFQEALELIHGVFDDWSRAGRLFAWRGQPNAAWPMHSSLYRRLLWTRSRAKAPEESHLEAEEDEILTAVHQWELHVGPQGRLSALNQLAVLQHYGAPTRLIDVTFNPLIGLWFAVQERRENGTVVDEDKDARLFAVDVTGRLINEDDDRRCWEDSLKRPWRPGGETLPQVWTTRTFAWRPARLDHRIAAQNGGFLLGGVATSSNGEHPVQWPRGPSPSAGKWKIDEVRQAISIPLRVHKIDVSGGGGVPENPVYTARIKAAGKAAIRKHLQDLYGYRESTIYPDFSGFALYGRPELKTRP